MTVKADAETLAAIAQRISQGVSSLAEEARQHGEDYHKLRSALVALGHPTSRPPGSAVPKLPSKAPEAALLRGIGMSWGEAGRHMGVTRSYVRQLDGMWLDFLKRTLGDKL